MDGWGGIDRDLEDGWWIDRTEVRYPGLIYREGRLLLFTAFHPELSGG